MGYGGPWQGHTAVPFEGGTWQCLGMWWCPGEGHGSALGRGNMAVPWGGTTVPGLWLTWGWLSAQGLCR